MNYMLFVVLGLFVALIVVNKLDKSKKKKQDENKNTSEKSEENEQLNK